MGSFKISLNHLMLSNNMTQIELSKMSGLTHAAVSMLLKGTREPSLSTILKLQKALNGVSLDILVTGKKGVKHCSSCAKLRKAIKDFNHD